MQLASPRGNPVDRLALMQGVCVVSALYWDRADALQQLLVGGPGQIVTFRHQPYSWPPSWCLISQGDTYWLGMAGTSNLGTHLLLHIGGTFLTDRMSGGGLVNGAWLEVWNHIWD